ncbi:Glycerol operon regulatory protein [Aquimixticola soesokkakensis]|uniref:Glycerol operon regulatory protein n=1 Tax=Aquimixticola soesokkakensis TaxID=1519096 RepID=A0A1Y5T1W0_9RHOB|nr:IclR family transcriptional regulator [Aquimixticola soesokkakensis]SLN54035.1 Glycerol operon regulatory protein [Aquimixticola soesokkakensis]
MMDIASPSVRTKETKSEGRGVQSIEQGAKLLAALADEAEPMMLKDLAKVAGFAPAQAHAYLVSYRKIGMIEQDEDTGRYRLGHFAIDLGMTRMRASDPIEMACDAAKELSKSTSLNVALVVWGSFGPTVIHVYESGSQINMNTRPGTVYSMTGTASGQIFSAFLPETAVKEAINKEKREGALSGRVGQARFVSKKEMDHIRDVGFATVEDPPVPGISAYSAPIFDYSDQIILAMTIIGEDQYLQSALEDTFIPALLATTQKLSAELGYRPSR